jgi:hypothetical protein
MAAITPRQPLASAIAFRDRITSAIAGRQSTNPPSVTLTYNEHFYYNVSFFYNPLVITPGVAIPRANTSASVTSRNSTSASMKAR